MDVMDAIYTRRSIRRFRKEDVPDEIIRKVIDPGRFAPSAHNRQPWEFIIIRDDEKKRKLNEGRTWTKFLPDTPIVIVVCAGFQDTPRPVKEGKGVLYYSVQDTAAAIQNILLSAHGMGLGTCWVGDFDESFVKKLLAIPEEFQPVALIALGYPEQVPPAPPKRRPLDEIIHWEKF